MSLDLIFGLIGGVLVALILMQAVQRYRDPTTGDGWFSAFERSLGKLVLSLIGMVSGAVATAWDALVDPNVAAAVKSALGGLDPKWVALVPVVIAFAAYHQTRKGGS